MISLKLCKKEIILNFPWKSDSKKIVEELNDIVVEISSAHNISKKDSGKKLLKLIEIQFNKKDPDFKKFEIKKYKDKIIFIKIKAKEDVVLKFLKRIHDYI